MAHARSLTGSVRNMVDFTHLDDTVFDDTAERTTDKITHNDPVNFTFGAGDNQVNLIYHARLTTPAAVVNLDLVDNTLIDEFGGSLNFTHIKVFQLINLDAANPLYILGPEGIADSLLTILIPAAADVVDRIIVPPMGNVLFVSPLAGFATAGGADRIEVDPVGATIDFDVTIVGIGVRTELT